jgi:hypothetical protein
MTSLRGQASWDKMMSLGGKVKALACHPAKYVNKAEVVPFPVSAGMVLHN